MEKLVPYQSIEVKNKYIQIRTTESFYNTVRSFAKEHKLSVTEAVEIGLSLLMEEKIDSE